MTPDQFLHDILNPGIAWCKSVPGWHVPFDDRARILMLAIAGQESAWKYRAQVGGPARGFWQFEQGGGVRGVLENHNTSAFAVKACDAAGIPRPALGTAAVYTLFSVPAGDNLSVAFARLLLFSEPHRLPDVGDEDAAYETYIRNWRPGKPSRERWATVYPQAMAADKAFVAKGIGT